MTYIGSVKDSEGSMRDERRMEQERIQGFCPAMPSDGQAAWECAERFRGLAEGMGAIGAAMNAATQAPLPYLIVPREPEFSLQLQAELDGLTQTDWATIISGKSEADTLRELLAAANAKIAALTAPEHSPVHDVMARAVSRWPGSQGFIQGIRWRGGI